MHVRRSINRRRFSALAGNPERSDEMGIMRALMYNQQSTGSSHLPVPLPPAPPPLLMGLQASWGGVLAPSPATCWWGEQIGEDRSRWLGGSRQSWCLSGQSGDVPQPQAVPVHPWDTKALAGMLQSLLLPPLWSSGSGHSLAFWLP